MRKFQFKFLFLFKKLFLIFNNNIIMIVRLKGIKSNALQAVDCTLPIIMNSNGHFPFWKQTLALNFKFHDRFVLQSPHLFLSIQTLLSLSLEFALSEPMEKYTL